MDKNFSTYLEKKHDILKKVVDKLLEKFAKFVNPEM